MDITALIPARGGSKSIPRKNIREYKGKPLIAHSIEVALKSKYITNVIVSTDDTEIANIARKYGAKVPYMRPSHLAEDNSTDLDVFKHHLLLYNTDILVHLRPTYPNRTVDFLDLSINYFLKHIEYDSLRTITPTKESPYKMYRLTNGNLVPLFKKIDDIDEPFNACRQTLPQCLVHNGCIDIVKSHIVKNGSMCGEKILPLFMNENFDIDTEDDFQYSLENYHLD